MAQVSEWQTEEAKNTSLDELTLSGEGGLYTNKVMCAVKKKFDEVDGKLDAVAGGLVFRGAKATYADLEAVTDPAVGDMYSVTALGGENYAWDGTAWDSLGTSDANVVHRTGAETVAGAKTFSDPPVFSGNAPRVNFQFLDISKGTPPAENKFATVCFVADKDGFEEKNRIGLIDVAVRSSGTVETRLITNKFEANNSSTVAILSLACSSDGTKALTVPLTKPASNGDLSLGTASAKWSEVFAATGTINTSDERQKESIALFSDEVLDAWENIDFLQFKFSSAVEAKGEAARIHCGLIAQRVVSAFESAGLDATKFGIVCYDSWPASDEMEAGDSYGVRYVEALCLEAACQRRRAERLEARIADLEARLGVN